jgi:hypothetical protein
MTMRFTVLPLVVLVACIGMHCASSYSTTLSLQVMLDNQDYRYTAVTAGFYNSTCFTNEHVVDCVLSGVPDAFGVYAGGVPGHADIVNQVLLYPTVDHNHGNWSVRVKGGNNYQFAFNCSDIVSTAMCQYAVTKCTWYTTSAIALSVSIC